MREKIIEMALEAGCSPFEFGVTTAHVEDLERFYNLAVQHERDRLHALNQELLKALHSISLASQDSGSTREGMGLYARAAIAKAEGEKQ